MQRNEDGKVYRGASDRCHIADGERANTGAAMAEILSERMRHDAFNRKMAETNDLDASFNEAGKPLCPGCYMTVLFNMAVALAKANGQSMSELGNTLAVEFGRLADGGPDRLEEVRVVLDDEPFPVRGVIL